MYIAMLQLDLLDPTHMRIFVRVTVLMMTTIGGGNRRVDVAK